MNEKNKKTQPTAIHFNPKDFEQDLASLNLSTEESGALLETVFQIAVNFVDLAFSIHPTQQACGQNVKNSFNSTLARKNPIHWKSSLLENNAMSPRSESER